MELNAITLTTADMDASVAFWLVPGLAITFGGPTATFTSLRLGPHFVNLIAQAGVGADGRSGAFWGRVIIHVDSPDDLHARYLAAGYRAETEPADALWGERYFHIRDPGGHEISFARPLRGGHDVGEPKETGR